MRIWKRYRVGEFIVNTADRTIAAGGESRSIAPKEFDLLLLLIENAGGVVEKDEILARLWPDAHVTEANLTQYVYRLRGLLGADAIRTVPRRGYLFTLPVAEEPAPAQPQAAPETSHPTQPAKLRRWLVIAAAFAAALVALAASSRGRPGTPTPEAYDLFLRGKARLEASHAGSPRLIQADERDGAVQLLRRSIAADPNFADAHAALAQALCYATIASAPSKLLDQSVTAAHAALRLDKSNVAARVALICAAHIRGSYNDALRLANEIRHLPHSSPEAFFAAGEAFLRAGLAEKSIIPLQSAVSAAPNNVHYRQQLAYALMFVHRPADCIATLSPILKKGEGGLWYAMNCYKELRRFEEAIAAGRKMVSLDPEAPTSYRGLAISYRAAGREAEARAILQQAIEHFEGVEETQRNYRVRSFLALMTAHLGRRGETERWVKSSLELDPDNSFLLYQAGLAYGILGNDDLAIVLLEKAVDRGFALKYLFDWQIRPEMGVPTLTSTRRYKQLEARLETRLKEMEAALQN